MSNNRFLPRITSSLQSLSSLSTPASPNSPNTLGGSQALRPLASPLPPISAFPSNPESSSVPPPQVPNQPQSQSQGHDSSATQSPNFPRKRGRPPKTPNQQVQPTNDSQKKKKSRKSSDKDALPDTKHSISNRSISSLQYLNTNQSSHAFSSNRPNPPSDSTEYPHAQNPAYSQQQPRHTYLPPPKYDNLNSDKQYVNNNNSCNLNITGGFNAANIPKVSATTESTAVRGFTTVNAGNKNSVLSSRPTSEGSHPIQSSSTQAVSNSNTDSVQPKRRRGRPRLSEKGDISKNLNDSTKPSSPLSDKKERATPRDQGTDANHPTPSFTPANTKPVNGPRKEANTHCLSGANNMIPNHSNSTKIITIQPSIIVTPSGVPLKGKANNKERRKRKNDTQPTHSTPVSGNGNNNSYGGNEYGSEGEDNKAIGFKNESAQKGRKKDQVGPIGINMPNVNTGNVNGSQILAPALSASSNSSVSSSSSNTFRGSSKSSAITISPNSSASSVHSTSFTNTDSETKPTPSSILTSGPAPRTTRISVMQLLSSPVEKTPPVYPIKYEDTKDTPAEAFEKSHSTRFSMGIARVLTSTDDPSPISASDSSSNVNNGTPDLYKPQTSSFPPATQFQPSANQTPKISNINSLMNSDTTSTSSAPPTNSHFHHHTMAFHSPYQQVRQLTPTIHNQHYQQQSPHLQSNQVQSPYSSQHSPPVQYGRPHSNVSSVQPSPLLVQDQFRGSPNLGPSQQIQSQGYPYSQPYPNQYLQGQYTQHGSGQQQQSQGLNIYGIQPSQPNHSTHPHHLNPPNNQAYNSHSSQNPQVVYQNYQAPHPTAQQQQQIQYSPNIQSFSPHGFQPPAQPPPPKQHLHSDYALHQHEKGEQHGGAVSQKVQLQDEKKSSRISVNQLLG